MKYVCIADLQSAHFATGYVGTAEQWRQKAKEWARQDSLSEAVALLDKMPRYAVIDEIREIWQLEIIPAFELRDKHKGG